MDGEVISRGKIFEGVIDTLRKGNKELDKAEWIPSNGIMNEQTIKEMGAEMDLLELSRAGMRQMFNVDPYLKQTYIAKVAMKMYDTGYGIFEKKEFREGLAEDILDLIFGIDGVEDD